jgi:hypothetical protein
MQRLVDPLEAIGRSDVEVRLVTIRTAEEALRLGFTGSPTILIDGRAPIAPPQAVAALSCRLYPTAQGTSGSPSIDQLTAALLGRDQPDSKQ